MAWKEDIETPRNLNSALELDFLKEWTYLDLLKPQPRITWEEAALLRNVAVAEFLQCAYPDIDSNIADLVIAFCGDGQDDHSVRRMVYNSARAADRRKALVDSIRWPRPLYAERDVEPVLIWPRRTARLIFCCPWIYGIILTICFVAFAPLLYLFFGLIMTGSYSMRLLRDLTTESGRIGWFTKLTELLRTFATIVVMVALYYATLPLEFIKDWAKLLRTGSGIYDHLYEAYTEMAKQIINWEEDLYQLNYYLAPTIEPEM